MFINHSGALHLQLFNGFVWKVFRFSFTKVSRGLPSNNKQMLNVVFSSAFWTKTKTKTNCNWLLILRGWFLTFFYTSVILLSYPVIWQKYCRCGVKPYSFNQSILDIHIIISFAYPFNYSQGIKYLLYDSTVCRIHRLYSDY